MWHEAFARILGRVAALVLVVAGLSLMAGPPAQADTQPDPGTLETVSADALPTWQINGVVWSQAVVGNTVYAVGSFTKARPPGVDVGGPGEVDALNIFAYDITTGERVASFSHSLNAQGLFVTPSPNGQRIYVGGDFTAVDGFARGHIVAFDTATGALVPGFTPNIGGNVRTVQATNDTVWVGGAFTAVGASTRMRLASFQASNGAILPWNPSADDENVWSMVLTPDKSRVIVGGPFSTLNGQPNYGMGSLDAVTGENRPWAANQTIRNAGSTGAIVSLRADGDQIYGTGYAFGGPTNFEHTFAADPTTGAIAWLNDCHGDTYDTFPMNGVLYDVSHSHDCSWINEFPETTPRTWHYLLASPTHPTTPGVNKGPDNYGWNFNGWPASNNLHWFPYLLAGVYTGQGQAGWSLAGNSDYLVVGGEFRQANYKPQQGLVRYTRRELAPNKRGMEGFDAKLQASSVSSGEARVRWLSQWDMDNENIRYDLYRDGGSTPIYTVTSKSNFWIRPTLGFIDTGLTPGSSHTYRVKASDPFNNNSVSPESAPVTISNAVLLPYAKGVVDDGASSYWRLGESSGSALLDFVGFSDMTGGGMTRGVTGAITGDSDTATTFSGSSSGTAGTNGTVATPGAFSIEAWFRTSTSRGGKIVGYGDAATGSSSNYDRHIYMENNGNLRFGVNNGALRTLRSPSTYRDNNWHQVIGTLDDNGMSLFVDGKRVAYDSSVTSGQQFTGRWRIGGDNLSGWPSRPTSNWFAGTIDDVSIYDSALSVQKVQKHFVDSGRTLAVPAVPADAYGKAVYNSGPELYWRLNETSGTVANDTSRYFNPGTYTGSGVTKNVTGPIPGNNGITTNGSSGSVGATIAEVNPTRYSEELWFKTSTTQGGKLIGFGSSASGSSSSYDRHVYMLNNGRLRFGAYTGAQVFFDTAASYNNNQWHHMVATQGLDGMKLYVDGALVGSDPNTVAQAFTGYWRIGGDNTWGGATSNYFSGSLDEAAVYNRVLPVGEVRAHYEAGGGIAPNDPPVANFTHSENFLTASFDGSSSSDVDGTIASYSWNFGDGTPAGSGVTPTHTYGLAGTYSVTLTVTDNRGGTGSVTKSVTVVDPPPNVPPNAAFTTSLDGLQATFDGTGSTDSDGTIASYSWNFGDGTPAGSGPSPTHTYAATGTYTVTLTVTDNRGGTGSVSHDVNVSGLPAVVQLAADAFSRTVTNAWGTADQGGPWTINGNAPNFAVGAGVGTIKMPSAGSGPSVFLGGLASDDTDLQATVSLDKAPLGGTAGVDQGILMRRIAGQGDYRAKVRFVPGGAVRLGLFRTDSAGAQTAIVAEANVAGITYAAGDVLNIRAQAFGTSPTTVRAKLWRLGDPEPSAWLATGTDTTAALQSTGAIGFHSFLAGTVTNAPVVARFDNVNVYKATTLPDGVPTPNQPPTAAFTHSSSFLTASFDGSGSSDADGVVVSYSWNFGDGTPAGSGASPNHTYGSAGTYTVALTVTDDDGDTGSISHSVTVTAPPPNIPPTAAFTSSTTFLQASFDSSGSSDADGSITARSWNFGDGSPAASGVSPTHDYATGGTYSVTLTVTDNNGATDSVSHNVTVNAPPAIVQLAADAFSRTVTNGWGTADQGGPWTTNGNAANFAVGSGVGSLRMPSAGAGPSVFLGGLASDDTDLQATVSLDVAPLGGTAGVDQGILLRRVAGQGDYRAKVRFVPGGAVRLGLFRTDSAGAQTAIVAEANVAGITYAAGDVLNVRAQAFGTSPTTVRAKLWRLGDPEPSAWLATGTDTTAALQSTGAIGFHSFLAGSVTNAPIVARFDNVNVYKATTLP